MPRQPLANLIADARKDAGLTQAELASRAHTSQSAVARYEKGEVAPSFATLSRLLKACGRSLTVSASAGAARIGASDHPSGPDEQLLRERRSDLLALATAHGTRNPRLFGSLARNEQRLGSDIDLLVDLDDDRTLLDLAAFRADASELLSLPVDVATPDMLKQRVRGRVLAEARPL